MYNTLVVLLLIISVLIIIAVMMQPSKQNSAASAFTGGATELFGKQKARGFVAVMQRATTVLAVLWMGLALVLVIMNAK